MKLHTLAFAAMTVMMGAAVAGPIDISVGPAKPLIEQGKGQQLLNIDFLIKNDSQDKVELSEVEVSVLGEADKLVAQYRVGANGRSVFVVPNRFIEPGKQHAEFVIPGWEDTERFLDQVVSTLRKHIRAEAEHYSPALGADRALDPQAYSGYDKAKKQENTSV